MNMNNNYVDYETVKLLIDTILYEAKQPLTVSSVLKQLLSIEYGNQKIVKIVNNTFLDNSSIEILQEVCKLYEQSYADMLSTINELKEECEPDELEEYVEELERLKELITILRNMTKDNMVYTPEEEDYIFITLEDPDNRGSSIIARDVEQEDSEVVLRHLDRMEELVKSQLHAKGRFDIASRGNGIHNHGKNPSHTLYKHVGDMIRIQIRRAGKEGNLIAVLAISPPAEVHRNASGEEARTDLYRRREEMLDDFLSKCPKDEDGTYTIPEEELSYLQSLYLDFKNQLRINMISTRRSNNIDILEDLRKKISHNIEQEKAKQGGI